MWAYFGYVTDGYIGYKPPSMFMVNELVRSCGFCASPPLGGDVALLVPESRPAAKTRLPPVRGAAAAADD